MICMSNNEVALNILSQLGRGTLFMLGFKKGTMLHSDDSLSFRIRGSRTVNHIKITLNPSDDYTIVFGRIRGIDYKVVSTVEGIYCDALHGAIERATGLATRMPQVRGL